MIYWTKEFDNNDDPMTMFPGMSYGNIVILSDGTLKIGSVVPDNTGHYSCVVINEVGSAMAR